MKKKKKTGPKPKPEKDQWITINTKMSKQDRQVLRAQAKKYAQGNLSAWMRFAGLNFKPRPTVRITSK